MLAEVYREIMSESNNSLLHKYSFCAKGLPGCLDWLSIKLHPARDYTFCYNVLGFMQSIPLEELGQEFGHVVGGFALLFYACYGSSSVGSWLREIT